MKDVLKFERPVKLKVLFADDEPALQELMHLELPRMGHEVTVCPDGNTAVAANYCSDPANLGKLVTLKWVQHVHTIAVPILGSWPINPTVTGSFRCE